LYDVEKKNSRMELKKVDVTDSKFLYDLLAQRNSNAFISHSREKMPTYAEHIKFVKSKPYSKWFIIKFCSKKVGSISLTKQNEIGIWLMKNVTGKGIGTEAFEMFLKTVPRSRYLANINPTNSHSIKFFKKNGFKLLQHTYELIPSKIT
jgi:RimJ/RimL family protein N-acetyltransferase